jgi:putative ABC transport system ATP-binding protein
VRKKENTSFDKDKRHDNSEVDDEADEVISLLKDNVIIKAQNLVKDYKIGEYIVRAVDGVSLSIRKGDFIVIRGPSGAGKTTLLNLIGGLDSPEKDKGKIFEHGVKISDMEEESLATFRLINSGFIFQNYNLISTLTAEENVIFVLNLAGVPFKKARERAVKLLKRVGLGQRREHLPFQLSAGEQQRVAIARALANDPPVILADEPTANLDKKSSEIVRDLFRDLRDLGKTIIIATHDDYLIDIADRIIDFEEGKIINETIQNRNQK